MLSQGADTKGIKREVTKMMNRHWQPFVKSCEQIASDIATDVSSTDEFL